MEQSFVIVGAPHDGQISARALFKGGLYDRRTRCFVAVAQLMQAIGISAESAVPSPDVEAFLHTDSKIKDARSGAVRANEPEDR